MAQKELFDQTYARGKASFLLNFASAGAETIDVSGLANSSGATARVNIIDVEWTGSAAITIDWTNSGTDERALTLSGNGAWKEVILPYSTAGGATGDITVTSVGTGTVILTVRKVAGFDERTDYTSL